MEIQTKRFQFVENVMQGLLRKWNGQKTGKESIYASIAGGIIQATNLSYVIIARQKMKKRKIGLGYLTKIKQNPSIGIIIIGWKQIR